MGQNRSVERTEFLAAILWEVACNNGGYGGLKSHTVHVPEGQEAEWYAEMYETPEADLVLLRVDLDTIARGIGVISRSVAKEITEGYDKGETLLHNARTGERLYMSKRLKAEIVAASFANDPCGTEVGDLDIISFLAIVECGLFGCVRY